MNGMGFPITEQKSEVLTTKVFYKFRRDQVEWPNSGQERLYCILCSLDTPLHL